MATERSAHYPGLAPIDAYGNGGFRFADMSHRGSLLIVPDGIFSWPATSPAEINLDILRGVFNQSDSIDVFLLGTGETQVFPPLAFREAFAPHNIVLEVMNTGSACRTYNVLHAEQRSVSAALVAID